VDERFAVLKVRGIHCEGCAGNIEHALKAIHGVREVNVSVGNGKVSVTYDPASAKLDAMKEAIRNAGFSVS
jgi:copper chaperone CopZ